LLPATDALEALAKVVFPKKMCRNEWLRSCVYDPLMGKKKFISGIKVKTEIASSQKKIVKRYCLRKIVKQIISVKRKQKNESKMMST
jgi:hypothetical protein